MSGQPVPSQLDQVLPQFYVQKAGPYHPFGRIRIAPFGKGGLRILAESGYTLSPLNNVITIDDERIKNHLDRVVRGSVEETLNGLLEAEADRLCNAQRYERSEARRDTRAGHYERRLQAPGRGHHGSSMGHAGTRDRLQAALPRLQDRLAELGAAEEDARRRAVYDKVKAERDKLAEELARVYPPLVDQLVDLMTRLAASDQALNACNRALPRDAEHLPTAEEIARGLHDYEVQYCKEKGRRLDPPAATASH